MGHQVFANFFAQAGQVGEHAGRETNTTEDFHQLSGDHRCLLGGLHNDRVPGHQGRGGHAGENRQGEVPGRDHHRHSARLVQVEVDLAGQVIKLTSGCKPQHVTAIIDQVVDRFANIRVGFAPGLPSLNHLPRGQLGPVGAHRGGGAEEEVCPLCGRRRTPGWQRLQRGRDAALGLGESRSRYPADDLVRV